ncbi:MAG: hypothetical protein QW051_00685, partial [Candidatus Aenigmatarchaeota archaeon]
MKKQKNNRWVEFIPFVRLFFPEKTTKESLNQISMFYVYNVLIIAFLFYVLSPFPVSVQNDDKTPIFYEKVFEKDLKVMPEELLATTDDARRINEIWLSKLTIFFYSLISLSG